MYFISFKAKAQQKNKKLIQFSGIIAAADSSRPIPFVNIIIKSSKKGTISDFVGFFSMAVNKHDTVVFSCVGYKKNWVIIPDSIKGDKYSLIKILKSDTILLRMAEVRPLPPLDQFKQIFLSKKIPDDNLEKAKKNLARAEIKARFNALPNDGYLNYRYAVQQNADKLYYAGQLPPIRLLDPLAWARFIKQWQNGELKIQQ
jgi:hypothetical protein